MVDLYKYRKPVRRHWYAKFKLWRRLIVMFVVLIGLILIGLWLDSRRSGKASPETSMPENVDVSDNFNTFHTAYFEFKDTGKWAINKQDSTPQKFVFFKYRGVQPQQHLTVYVNQVPIPLYLATSRVVPVRIVNNDSLDVTNVYGPCSSTYGVNELHKVKTVTIEGAEMLCDPDTPQYSIVLSEVGGDWRLDMKRPNGSPVSFVIIFKDVTFNPGPESVLRIADSFKAM